ncbi:MAG: hypothetical protein A2700_00785 [Candidatus Blackburnbacteria bacterium RIFCSPHIGHO2_01_FULL_44_64]|uniref:Uncharacterized protein n=1 Tax=Candidatus Blackburnbacteria bacterium RIFCSPHIGHO2_02_FULL_44_20 TaxID=1797516 RepID=A0A1G1V526_9BACT|nr:MAG: hypothetical protein A2700_00785 [Candidatus Blackburnbacteria bacterium RIFCSPHIGHO2_01_FULL_44_64]OGY10494.1 MAG: hypothetical protein A3D26_00135 [Candidatus Blackburnbacteria bacterium RIFCSPHIGHO2_02_FULL_44_20]OGY12311.1 MAG: hypothetical protein A3E16_00515 [Candidatus Blackburnbacteria bacterium RIFCSPHIGHO2_12_FULL_44_25]OGY15040.1 MAG: hypothetical protein A3A62_02130 [Candidatus Blackburnbacteria bacterium RIFCSPLOWO2_01_FULL_44_43]OGY17296.1 MAG: hypothetical protein A3H88_0
MTTERTTQKNWDYLMSELPLNTEDVGINGPFYIRNNGDSWSVVILNPVPLSISGAGARNIAVELANTFNAKAPANYEPLEGPLPSNIERVPTDGPIAVRWNKDLWSDSWSLVALDRTPLTFNGEGAKDQARDAARTFNQVWEDHFTILREQT